MLRLTITAQDRVRHVPLRDATPLGIGSATDNEIVIAAPGVSRHHARVERTARGVTIVDLASKNGVIVEGKIVRKAMLVRGDTFRLGAASLVVEEVATADDDIAIRLMDESSGHWLTPLLDTDSLHAVADGPAGAIRWMQRVEALTAHERFLDAQVLLEDARRIATAETLLLFEAAPPDVHIAAIAGPLPTEQEVDSLSRARPAEGWELLGGTASGFLLAVQADNQAAWKRDFLDYVRGKLASALGAPDGAALQRPRAAVLPQRMIVGSSEVMKRLVSDIAMMAGGGGDVLILGETGTGKELVAGALHQSGARPAGPMVAVNCAEIPASQIEAELFGIEKGAATGVEARRGLFLAADGGTLFLDEIGEMAEALQPILLRVLQQREVRAIASTSARAIDVRIIASTNRDLEELVAQGRFRADLYYRLRQSLICVPPLRERSEDIPPLATAIIQRTATSASKRIQGISRKALALLVGHDWPGNIRQMENVLREAVLRCPHGAVVQSEHLSLPQGRGAISSVTQSTPPRRATLQNRLADVEKIAIIDALARAQGNKAMAARLLGITRQGLYAKLKRHRIEL